jgi:hypothetical protein
LFHYFFIFLFCLLSSIRPHIFLASLLWRPSSILSHLLFLVLINVIHSTVFLMRRESIKFVPGQEGANPGGEGGGVAPFEPLDCYEKTNMRLFMAASHPQFCIVLPLVIRL